MSTQDLTERGDVVDDGMLAASTDPTRRTLLKVAVGGALAALTIAGAATRGTTGVAAHDGRRSSSGDGGNDGQDDDANDDDANETNDDDANNDDGNDKDNEDNGGMSVGDGSGSVNSKRGGRHRGRHHGHGSEADPFAAVGVGDRSAA